MHPPASSDIWGVFLLVRCPIFNLGFYHPRQDKGRFGKKFADDYTTFSIRVSGWGKNG
jgi:hypothetical protein